MLAPTKDQGTLLVMSGFITSLRKSFQHQVDRHHNLPFLKATMAACALVATADGHVSFSESVRVDQIVETLDQLKTFDPHEAVDLFKNYSDMILKNPKEGHREVLRELEPAMENRETAELLIRICLAVAESNGETSLVDQIEIVTLCSLLDVDPAGFGLYKEALAEQAKAGSSQT